MADGSVSMADVGETHLAEFVEILSWLRLRPMIDNPGPLAQTPG
jgi:hypothetical protein